MGDPDHSRGCLQTPIGMIEVRLGPRGAVTAVAFTDQGGLVQGRSEALGQLEEYFNGQRRSFDLDLDPEGTVFEKRVWNELRLIPYGATTTYGEIARKLGDPGASRAVGVANARNPIAIIIPCHRVIGADGDLTGYAGGMHRKRWLLAHESGQASLDFEKK